MALILSLTKSEKRQFRLYVNRLGINTDAKFLLLFDVMDKMNEYDENKILEKKITTKQQLSNLKAHLYRQILISLRTNPSNQNNKILIREQMDFATILYNKGLYKQSLKILDKSKQIAIDLEEKDIASEIVEFEKVIESQYITRSIKTRADDLISNAKLLGKLNALNSKLSNLSLKLYSMMLSNGYAQNDADKEQILDYFEENIPKKDLEIMGFREKLWFCKAHVWKFLLLQDFINAYKYALQWVELFYQHANMIQIHPVWFIKGNSYLLNALFLLRKRKRFEYWKNRFKKTLESSDFPRNENTEAVIFTVLYNARMNMIFMKGDYADAAEIIQEIKEHKEFHDDKIDEHHILVLNFKIAATYFGNKDYENCIAELAKIIHHKNSSIREDLYFNSRILSLMAMLDSGLDENLEEFLDDTLKFFRRMKHPKTFHKMTAALFEEIYEVFPTERKAVAKKFLQQYQLLAENPYNTRDFVYLDLISWLESIIENRNISDIIRDKSV
ncbi:hypothetical protein [Daejeonia sp. YH14]|uniref:hypothetical protein n=1 Tax=Daejeonia sp. YH14 TaxID=3439042 RepID=UPI003F49ADCA